MAVNRPGWCFKALRLSLCLLCLPHTPLWAAEPVYTRHPSLAVMPFSGPNNTPCQTRVHHELSRARQYDVLPIWYVSQQLHHHDPNDWPTAATQLKAELLLVGSLRQEGNRLSVSTLLWQAQSPEQPDQKGQIIYADTVSGSALEVNDLCQTAAQRLLGQAQPPAFRTPALSASLSLIFPGAGHFYTGKPLNIAMGVVFLASYLAVASQGFRSTSESQITRQQWGALLMLVTLSDIISAYFFSLPVPE